MRSTTKILIGPVTCDPCESVGAVNESLIEMLVAEFDFVRHIALRKSGKTSSSALNLTNGVVFFRHLWIWLRLLLRERPKIAHYAITSDWNMEKSLFLLWAAQWFGCRTIGHLHGGKFIEFWEHANPIRKRFGAHVIRRLDAFVVLSEGWRGKVLSSLGLPSDVVMVVNNPVDQDFEHHALTYDVERHREAAVLCFGIMDTKKGVFDILKAAAILGRDSEVTFWLVGPERESGIVSRIEIFLQQHGLSDCVKVMGPVHGTHKLELFRRATLFLLPSYVENFPITVLEAAAAGLPVICSEVGATPEFFTDRESAWFVAPGAAEEIAQAIVTLMASSSMRDSLATAAREVFLTRLQRLRIREQMRAVYASVTASETNSPKLQSKDYLKCV